MKTILVIATLLGGAAGVRAETLALSQIDLSKAAMGYGAAGRDKSAGGRALSIGNRAFTTGFGTHSPSVLRVQFDGRAKQFSAWVGVDDEVTAKSGSVVFWVWAPDANCSARMSCTMAMRRSESKWRFRFKVWDWVKWSKSATCGARKTSASSAAGSKPSSIRTAWFCCA